MPARYVGFRVGPGLARYVPDGPGVTAFMHECIRAYVATQRGTLAAPIPTRAALEAIKTLRNELSAEGRNLNQLLRYAYIAEGRGEPGPTPREVRQVLDKVAELADQARDILEFWAVK